MKEMEIEASSEKFEAMGHGSKIRYWIASEFMILLGYSDLKLFAKAIHKAIAACATLGIPYDENFKRRVAEGEPDDYNLSRFACYLVAMNGDARKPEIASAQAYFALIAESFRQHLEQSENVERVLLRSDVTGREKTLSNVAHHAGVINYAFFQNAGYRGMYNMSLNELKVKKGLDPKRTLIDYMGKTELAAHLFRITQTEQKITNEGISGQRPLEGAAMEVGKVVRQAMIATGGTAPEDLKISDNIHGVKRDLKSTQKRFRGMDVKQTGAHPKGASELPPPPND